MAIRQQPTARALRQQLATKYDNDAKRMDDMIDLAHRDSYKQQTNSGSHIRAIAKKNRKYASTAKKMIANATEDERHPSPSRD